MNALTIASNQLATRTADETFPTIAAMLLKARYDQEHSRERGHNLKDLSIEPTSDSVVIKSPKGTASFTNWSASQLARMVGAPAGYVLDLPPTLTADCLNHGIKASPYGTKATLLVRANGDDPVVRAVTTETYDRVYDAPYIEQTQNIVFNATSNRGGSSHSWQNAPIWGKPEGVAGFRGDRDMFLLQIDGGSIVTDPSAGSENQMYRGIMIGNSEVGARSIWYTCVLMRYICGNWMFWGAMIDSQFRRRHVGSHTLRDTLSAIGKLAYTWTNRSASQDEAIIRQLISREIAATKDAVVDELRKMGATKEQAESAYAACEMKENASPRSYWGIAQGLTRVSQNEAYTGDRFLLDQLAAKVMSRGQKIAA